MKTTLYPSEERFLPHLQLLLNACRLQSGPTPYEVPEDLNPHEHRQHLLVERGADVFLLYMRHTPAGWAAECSLTLDTHLHIGQARGHAGMLGAAAEALAALQAQVTVDLTPWLE